MAEQYVEIEGINYFTIFEQPSNGSSDTPCVLLIHALMSNYHMWESATKALHDAGYSTLRFDQLGHNKTLPAGSAEAALHMDDLTRHIHALVQARTRQPHVTAVVGCSIGGTMALRYGMLFPTDVGRIIDICSPGLTAAPSTQKLWADRLAILDEDRRSGGEVLCQATVKRWIPHERPEDDAVRALALTHVKTCTYEGYKVLADAIVNYDYAEDAKVLQRIKILILAGDEDTASSSKGLEELAGQLGAQFVEFKKTGHMLPLQRSKEFNEVLLKFLAE